MPRTVRWLLLLAVAPSPVAAAPPRAGGEFAVNTYTTSEQQAPDVAIDAFGRFVVVWESRGQDGGGSGIFGQRFDAAGAPLGAEFAVNAYTTGGQYQPEVAVHAAGHFVVVWMSGGQDGSSFGIFGRLFDAGGQALGDDLAVNDYTTFGQSAPAVGMDDAGDFVVAWTSAGPEGGGTSGIQARRFAASGAPLDGEFAVNSHTTGDQGGPAVAMRDDGSFVVAWNGPKADATTDVFARLFAADGTPATDEFQLNTYTTLAQGGPSLAEQGADGFLAVWPTPRDADGLSIALRRFDWSGNPVSVEFRANTFTTAAQQRPVVAADGTGAFTIAWESGTQDGSGASIAARSFTPSVAFVDEEFVVNTLTALDQQSPALAMDAAGRYVMAWQSNGADGSGFGVRAQRFQDAIFKDGFETGGLSEWSASATGGGDLGATGPAALAGTTVGLQAVVNDTAALFVQDDTPADEKRYRARFYLDPNGFDPGEAQVHRRTRTLIAFSEAPTRRVAAIVLRRIAGAYSLMGRARQDDNSQADTGFFPITDAPHAVEIDLAPASGPEALDGTFELWIDGVSMIRLTGLDNNRAEVDFLRMGALSVKTGAAGTILFDEFDSRRGYAIGPLP